MHAIADNSFCRKFFQSVKDVSRIAMVNVTDGEIMVRKLFPQHPTLLVLRKDAIDQLTLLAKVKTFVKQGCDIVVLFDLGLAADTLAALVAEIRVYCRFVILNEDVDIDEGYVYRRVDTYPATFITVFSAAKDLLRDLFVPKIAVYSAVFEPTDLQPLLTSCADADEMIVVNNGASLDAPGARVIDTSIMPYRFDTAKNIALANVSPDIDICINLDPDEILVDGWRDKLIDAWLPHTTRLRYSYVWSGNSEMPDLTFYGDHIHARDGYVWSYPIHEILTRAQEVHTFTDDELIVKRAMPSVDHSYRLGLLELAVIENPDNERLAHFLGREYTNCKQYVKAVLQLEQHLAMKTATWKEERAFSMLLLATAYCGLNKRPEAKAWLFKALAECPTREVWTEIAQFMHDDGNWEATVWAANEATKITQRSKEYVSFGDAWFDRPWSLLSIGCWHLGLKARAVNAARMALMFRPTDRRLLENLTLMERG